MLRTLYIWGQSKVQTPARRRRSEEDFFKQMGCIFHCYPVTHRLHETAIRPVIWYASGSWTVAKKSESDSDAFHGEVLRRTFGPMNENKAGRIRYDNDTKRCLSNPVELLPQYT
jgi:hypothetical protein